MSEAFKIYIARLTEGREEILRESLPPDFLEVKEKELAFSRPVELEGRAYLSDSDLVLHLSLSTFATLECAICNEPVEVPICLRDIYLSESVDAIRGGVFDFRELVRDTILLEIPLVAECLGACPKREENRPFLKGSASEPTHFPFADL